MVINQLTYFIQFFTLLYCIFISDSSYCLCDIGYTSSTSKECDIKICPKGDDPTTENQNYREINLTTGTKNGTVGVRHMQDML